jgi:hypothetical protein
MAVGSGTNRRWPGVLRVGFSVTLGLLAVLAFLKGMAWYWAVFVFCAASFGVVGRRRILRAGVTRASEGIVCRYVPWYESSAYLLNFALPLMGVASLCAGYAPGNPVWLRFAGILLLLATLLMIYAAYRMWSRCSVRFTPSTLTIRVADPRIRPGELPRERVEAITPKWVANSVSGAKALQIEIAYRPAESTDDAPQTVMLGLQLTVEPINLYGALVAWHDGAESDPNELLDRIEQLLRGSYSTSALR